MSFTDTLRRLFGIDSDNESDEMLDTEECASDSAPAVAESPVVEDIAELPMPPVVDPAMKAKIFDGVVAVFNEALPDFLRRSVDPSRQSEIIAASLDESLKRYLDDLSAEAMQYAEAKLKNAADTAHRESERLRTEMGQLEQQRTSLREQQLSAERRRRALADRVNDLEGQLASAEAEREQFDLERKSLLNKIKLADVQPAVIEDLQKEIERLKAGSAQSAADTAETEALKAELEQLKSALAEANEALEISRKALDDQRQLAETSQAMYNDLQNQLVDERDARTKAEAEVAETRNIYESVVEMQKQMQMVEKVIQKRDERISRLKATNKKLKEELAGLKEQLSDNAIGHRDGGLFDIIPEEPEQGAETTPEEEAALAALEDDFECPDWFVSQPEPGEGSLRTSEESFGYTPPVRKHTPENDAQLSLF